VNPLQLLALLSLGVVAWTWARNAQAYASPNLAPVANAPDFSTSQWNAALAPDAVPCDVTASCEGGYVEVSLPGATQIVLMPGDSWGYPIAAGNATIDPQADFPQETAPTITPSADYSEQEYKNLAAFLYVIRLAESGNDYSLITGGAHFSGYADHPFILNPSWPQTKTASGAYQIIKATWLEAQSALRLPDFSPQSQDDTAMYLISKHAAWSNVLAGDFLNAMKKLTGEWDAFKRMLAGTYGYTVAQAQADYQQSGGLLA
jgi:muramidase (phage lysozyme)